MFANFLRSNLIGKTYYMKPLRKDISPGTEVNIVQKQDQRTGNLTHGIVSAILTKSPSHPHGIKVRLESGEVGRVQKIEE